MLHNNYKSNINLKYSSKHSPTKVKKESENYPKFSSKKDTKKQLKIKHGLIGLNEYNKREIKTNEEGILNLLEQQLIKINNFDSDDDEEPNQKGGYLDNALKNEISPKIQLISKNMFEDYHSIKPNKNKKDTFNYGKIKLLQSSNDIKTKNNDNYSPLKKLTANLSKNKKSKKSFFSKKEIKNPKLSSLYKKQDNPGIIRNRKKSITQSLAVNDFITERMNVKSNFINKVPSVYENQSNKYSNVSSSVANRSEKKKIWKINNNPNSKCELLSGRGQKEQIDKNKKNISFNFDNSQDESNLHILDTKKNNSLSKNNYEVIESQENLVDNYINSLKIESSVYNSNNLQIERVDISNPQDDKAVESSSNSKNLWNTKLVVKESKQSKFFSSFKNNQKSNLSLQKQNSNASHISEENELNNKNVFENIKELQNIKVVKKLNPWLKLKKDIEPNYSREVLIIDKVYDSQSDEEDIEFENSINRKMEWYSFDPESDFLFYFRIILVFVFLYINFYKSFFYSFDFNPKKYSSEIVFNVFCDGLFFLEFIISFLTGYKKEDYIVYDLKIIFLNRIFEGAFFDLLYTIPFGSIHDFLLIKGIDKYNLIDEYYNIPISKFINLRQIELHKETYIFKILSWLRLLTFFKFLTYVNFFIEKIEEKYNFYITNLISSFKFILFFIWFCHISTCLWIYIGQSNLYYFGNGWINNYKLNEVNKFNTYITSFYFILVSTFTIGYGDISPSTNNEILFIVVFLMISNILNSLIISLFSSAVSKSSMKDIYFNKQSDILNEFINDYSIPLDLEKKLRNSISTMKQTFNQDKEELLNILPDILKNTMYKKIYEKRIRKMEFFKKKSEDFILYCVSHLKLYNPEAKEIIIHFGESVLEMNIINKGSINFYLGHHLSFYKLIKLIKGYHFGDVYMNSNVKSEYTLKTSSNDTEIYSITKKLFADLKNNFSEIMDEITKKSMDDYLELEILRIKAFDYYEVYKNLDEFKISIIKENINKEKEKIKKEILESITKVAKNDNNPIDIEEKSKIQALTELVEELKTNTIEISDEYDSENTESINDNEIEQNTLESEKDDEEIVNNFINPKIKTKVYENDAKQNNIFNNLKENGKKITFKEKMHYKKIWNSKLNIENEKNSIYDNVYGTYYNCYHTNNFSFIKEFYQDEYMNKINHLIKKDTIVKNVFLISRQFIKRKQNELKKIFYANNRILNFLHKDYLEDKKSKIQSKKKNIEKMKIENIRIKISMIKDYLEDSININDYIKSHHINYKKINSDFEKKINYSSDLECSNNSTDDTFNKVKQSKFQIKNQYYNNEIKNEKIIQVKMKESIGKLNSLSNLISKFSDSKLYFHTKNNSEFKPSFSNLNYSHIKRKSSKSKLLSNDLLSNFFSNTNLKFNNSQNLINRSLFVNLSNLDNSNMEKKTQTQDKFTVHNIISEAHKEETERTLTVNNDINLESNKKNKRNSVISKRKLKLTDNIPNKKEKRFSFLINNEYKENIFKKITKIPLLQKSKCPRKKKVAFAVNNEEDRSNSNTPSIKKNKNTKINQTFVKEKDKIAITGNINNNLTSITSKSPIQNLSRIKARRGTRIRTDKEELFKKMEKKIENNKLLEENTNLLSGYLKNYLQAGADTSNFINNTGEINNENKEITKKVKDKGKLLSLLAKKDLKHGASNVHKLNKNSVDIKVTNTNAKNDNLKKHHIK